MPSDERKTGFIARHGYWSEALEIMAVRSPEFFDAAAELLAVPWASEALPDLDKALIMVALNATPTNLNSAALRASIRRALGLGASEAAINETFELVSSLALHSCTFGVPKLFSMLEQSGSDRAKIPPFSAEQEALKAEFIKIRGYWGEFWDQVLVLSPAFFKAYLGFTSIPWQTGHIEPRLKELIYIAIDANVTHLYEQGVRVHIKNALACGATPAQIMTTYQLATSIGMQTFEVGLPILADEVKALSSGR